MVHEECWVAISHEGALLGGGFLMTRYFALTATGCLAGLGPGDLVQLHTARGVPLNARVVEVAEDVGLALLGLQPPSGADYPTPQADHAVKGDAWYAPYRPGPTVALLTGTVDDVARERHGGDGCAVSVIELSSDQPLLEYGIYAGGPVERRTDGHDTAVLGIILEPEVAGRLRDSGDHRLAAGAIGSVLEVFPELTPRNLLERLGVGSGPRPDPPLRPDPLPEPEPAPSIDIRPAEPSVVCGPSRPEPPGWSGTIPEPDGLVPPEVVRQVATAWYVLGNAKAMADAGIVDPRDLPPLTVRMLNDIVAMASEEEVSD
jgi:hypothetical protein